MKKFSRRELLLVTLFMGFSAGIIQVLIIREILSLCRGNELIIGMIFSSWFLGIYTGAVIKRPGDSHSLERRVLVSMFMLPLAAAFSIYLSGFIQIFIPRTIGTFYSFTAEFLFAFFFTLPVSFFIGLFFPSLVELIAGESGDRSGGLVFCIESLGSFAGGFVFSFLLVDYMNPIGIISMLVLCALILVSLHWQRRVITFALIPVVLIIFSGSIENKMFSLIWDKTHTGKLIRYSRTKYQKVSVESTGDTVSVYGDGVLMYTLPDRYEARGIFHLARALKPGSEKILLFGSGPGSLLYNLLLTGNGKVCYSDSDPELWDLLLPAVRSFYPSYNRERLVVTGSEMKHFLMKSSEQFDMIISLPPRPENIMLNRFYTREFYSLCREHLSEQGVFITALHGFSNYISIDSRNYIASIYAAFSNVFPVHIMTSGDTIYLIAAKKHGILPDNTDSLVSGYAGTGPSGKHQFEHEITDNFSPDELRMFFEKTQLEYFNSVIPPLAEKTGANSDIRPGAYWKNIVLTAFKEQSWLYFVIKNYVFIPFLLLLSGIAAVLAVKKRYGYQPMVKGTLIFLTGFASISVMLVIIMLYQNFHGIVYYRLAIINALFMLGLGLGSYCFNRKKPPGFRLPHVYIFIAFTVVLLHGITLYNTPGLLWLIILIFSFLCGAVFPMLFRHDADDYYASASVLDSMDNFGAIAGSLLTVVFLIPLTGIQGTIIFNAVLVIVACVTAFTR